MTKEKRNYLIVASLVFLLAGLLHLIRVIKGWDFVVSYTIIPIWVSWIVVVITFIMVWQGIKLYKMEMR